jgi:hypothetical protein
MMIYAVAYEDFHGNEQIISYHLTNDGAHEKAKQRSKENQGITFYVFEVEVET